jgi:hypothetical protein
MIRTGVLRVKDDIGVKEIGTVGTNGKKRAMALLPLR